MLTNCKRGACRTLHANGRIFTHRCASPCSGQRWMFWDGKVSGFRSTKGYKNQPWD